jgi:hypothetical protein
MDDPAQGPGVTESTVIPAAFAQNAPDYARDIVYGVVILVILLVYAHQRGEA